MKYIVRHGGSEIETEVERHGSAYRVRIGDRWLEADLVDAGHFVRSLRLHDGGRQYSLIHHRQGDEHIVTIGSSTISVEVIDPRAMRRRRADDALSTGGVVKALMPGRVVRVLVEKGAAVLKGSGLLIVEAMKMENEIQAPVDGVVDEIFVTVGDTVESGLDLVHIG